MQNIELRVEGLERVDILKLIQDSLGDRWTDAILIIRREVFTLEDLENMGDGGGHPQMKRTLNSLRDDNVIDIVVPDEVKFDGKALEANFIAASSKAIRAKVEEALDQIRQSGKAIILF